MPTADCMAWDISVAVKRRRVVSKAIGYFPLEPAQLWRLLACPESKSVFRVEGRKQLSYVDGKTEERVVFVAPVRIVFWKKWARTEVWQIIDMSDPSNVTVDFKLVQSDMMSHLSGSWHFEQLAAAGPGCLGRTRVTYCFEMWPKGVPTALRFMPGLLDAVKAAVAREAGQLLDKLAFVAHKVQPGMCILEAARQASLEVEAAGGSFKCLQLAMAGKSAEAAAAAAAEEAARQQQQQQALKTQPPKTQQVLCHALHDMASDGDDDCLLLADSISSGGSLEFEAGTDASMSQSSAASISSVSSGGSSSPGALVSHMSHMTFDELIGPVKASGAL